MALSLDLETVFGDLSKLWNALLRKKAVEGSELVVNVLGFEYVPFFVKFGDWLALFGDFDLLVDIHWHIVLILCGIVVVGVILLLIEIRVDAGIVIEDVVQIIVALDCRTDI